MFFRKKFLVLYKSLNLRGCRAGEVFEARGNVRSCNIAHGLGYLMDLVKPVARPVRKRGPTQTAYAREGEASRRFGFDNMANVSYTDDRSCLKDYKTVHGMAVNGLGGDMNAVGVGTFSGACRTANGDLFEFEIDDMLFIPKCAGDIISASRFVNECPEASHYVLRKNDVSYIVLEDGRRIDCVSKNDLNKLDVFVNDSSTKPRRSRISRLLNRFSDRVPSCFFGSDRAKVGSNYAHNLLCHLSERKMKMIKRHGLIDGLEWEDEKLNDCFPCAIGKSMLNNADKGESTRYTHRGQQFCSDIEGPVSTPAFGGYQYAVHFTDLYSRYSVVYGMKTKDEVGKCFRHFIKSFWVVWR